MQRCWHLQPQKVVHLSTKLQQSILQVTEILYCIGIEGKVCLYLLLSSSHDPDGPLSSDCGFLFDWFLSEDCHLSAAFTSWANACLNVSFRLADTKTLSLNLLTYTVHKVSFPTIHIYMQSCFPQLCTSRHIWVWSGQRGACVLLAGSLAAIQFITCLSGHLSILFLLLLFLLIDHFFKITCHLFFSFAHQPLE